MLFIVLGTLRYACPDTCTVFSGVPKYVMRSTTQFSKSISFRRVLNSVCFVVTSSRVAADVSKLVIQVIFVVRCVLRLVANHAVYISLYTVAAFVSKAVSHVVILASL